MKWAVLWCTLPMAFLVQWPHWSAAQSTSLNWAAWAAAAGALSFLEPFPKRSSRFPLFSLLILGIALRYLADILPTLIYTEWTSAWGTIAAFGSGACWLAVVLFGTVSVVRNSPSISIWLPKALFGFISSAVLLVILHELKIYSFWKIAENPGGFLPTSHILADICALSVPILISWQWWAVLPALLGIILAKSLTAMVGLLAGMVWLAYKDFKGNRNVIRFGLYFVFISAAGFMARTSLQSFYQLLSLRFYTWLAATLAILRNPLGIGMDSISYYENVVNKTHFRILPHSASDVLNTLLYSGWIGFPILGYLLYRGFKHLGSDARSASIVITFAMCCFARTVGFPQVALVAWVVWIAWKIENSHSYPMEDFSGPTGYNPTSAEVLECAIQFSGSDMEASKLKESANA